MERFRVKVALFFSFSALPPPPPPRPPPLTTSPPRGEGPRGNRQRCTYAHCKKSRIDERAVMGLEVCDTTQKIASLRSRSIDTLITISIYLSVCLYTYDVVYKRERRTSHRRSTSKRPPKLGRRTGGRSRGRTRR